MDYPFGSIGSVLDKDVICAPVKKFGINPYIIRQNVTNGKYLLVYQNNCFTGEIHPGVLRVDQEELKKKLNNWLKPSDRKYIKLVSCNSLKSTFEFDIDKWLNDGLRNCRPYVDIGCLNKNYRLGVPLPYMFKVNGLQMLYEKFICDKFKENIKKNTNLKKDVFSIIGDITDKTIGSLGVEMFEYKYNRTSNAVSVSLKPVFIGTVMAAASIFAKSKKTSKRKDFDQLVKKYGKFMKK